MIWRLPLLNFLLTKVIRGVALLLVCGSWASAQTLQIEQRPDVNPWNHLRLRNDPDNFQFAMVADLTGRERPEVFADAVRKLNLLQPEFVVSIGDLIEGHTNDPAQLDRDWDQFFKAVEPLEMPLFYVPGNHDYWYGTNQSWTGEREVYDMASVYKKRVGRSYYHFVYRNVLFLILNNSMGSSAEKEEQKKYITKTLTENANVRWTFTFFHYSGWGRGDDIWATTASLLKGRPFTSFAGNSHNYVKFQRDGQDYINIATTGGMSRLRGPAYGEFDHLVWVTMTKEGPRIVNLILDGIYDKNVRTVRSRDLMSRLLRESPISSALVVDTNGTFTGGSTRLQLSNKADVPLRLKGTFEPNDYVSPDPAVIDVVIPAGSEQSLDLKLNVAKPVPTHQVRTLVLNWEAIHSLPGDDPDVNVTGKHRVVIDTSAVAPRRSRVAFVEHFGGPSLHPAWTLLGPAGSFNRQGQYTLKDTQGVPDAPGTQYTDGRGIYTLTPLWHLPAAGLFRDLPPDSFEADLKLTNFRWEGDTPIFAWEFWDAPERVNNYGPSFYRAVILQAYRESGKYWIAIKEFDKGKRAPGENVSGTAGAANIDQRYRELGKVELDKAPSSLTLRANWRESSKTWKFSFGADGGEPTRPIPGGEFVESGNPSFEGKRNLIYVRKAQKNDGFSVELDEYRLLQ